MTGIVLRARGGVYEVETDQGVVEASLRGRLKRETRTGDRVVAGDRVEVEAHEQAGVVSWVIEEVRERRTALVRKAPGKAPRPKVIVANVDQIIIVFAAARPTPHLRMLDRFLVLCEASGLDALIVVNKVDVVPAEEVEALFGRYRDIGYPLLFTAANAGVGTDRFHDALRGRVSALTGPSGVGKSSLLNAVQPGLALRVASISEAVQKGRHTTVTAQLIPLECGGYVADTPGLRELGLWGIEPEDLDGCFPEFQPFLGTCRYGNSCTHTHEPRCAVLEAVAGNQVHPERYDSYRRLFAGEDEDA